MDTDVAVRVLDLCKFYGKTCALKNLKLDIYRGEIFGLLGPNGAGKSTLISLLASVGKPTSGEIIINSINISRKAESIKKIIGFVPQDIALYPALTGLENLDFWSGVYGLTGREKRERISSVLETVRLSDRAKDRVEKYSGGMKRRLNVAVALLHRPDILVMDEPMVGVDIQSRKYILDTLAALKSEGKTIIIASHDMEEIEGLCDRLAVMAGGEIKMTGSPGEVKRSFGAESMSEVLLRLMQ